MRSKINMIANSITELAEQIRDAPTTTGAKRIAEFSTLRSFAFASLFTEVFGCDGFCRLEEGSDPPDYCLTTPAAKISVEVTSITTGKLRIFRRKRFNPCSYTSMLRSGKSEPDAHFWNDLRTNRLRDDSEAIPPYENVGDLDCDYYQIVSKLLKDKLDCLARYHSEYEKNVLLVRDELSEFKSDFQRRIPVLKNKLNSIQPRLRFDAVVLVDGNHHSGVKAFKL